MATDDGGHARVRNLRRETADLLRAARGDRDSISAAIRAFIEESWELVRSPSAMWDHFTISSPSVPKMAGYDPADAEAAVNVFGRLMERFVAMLERDRVYERPFPADWAERASEHE